MKLYSVLLAIVLSACGSGEQEAPSAVKGPVTVELRGDSITRQSYQYLESYVAPGSTVINLGLDGARASDVESGRYGSMPPSPNPNTYYSFSFGTNECLNGFSAEVYQSGLERIIVHMKGYRTIIESPWLIQYGGPTTCFAHIDSYRRATQDLYIKYKSTPGYNLIMPEVDMRTDGIGDGIHLDESHSRHRMQLLATALYKLK